MGSQAHRSWDWQLGFPGDVLSKKLGLGYISFTLLLALDENFHALR